MDGPILPSPIIVELVEWRKTHCELENGSYGIAKQKASDYKR